MTPTTIKQRPTTSPSPQYEYQFKTENSILIKLVASYNKVTDEARVSFAERSKRITEREAALNKIDLQVTGGGTITAFERGVLEKDKQRFTDDERNLIVSQSLAMNDIFFVIKKHYSFWLEITNDFKDGFISKEKYLSYLLEYKKFVKLLTESRIDRTVYQFNPFSTIVFNTLNVKYDTGKQKN